MARNHDIDDDPQDDLDDDSLDEDLDGDDGGGEDGGSGWRGGWRRRVLRWAMIATAVGLGFLIPYTLYLNHQVSVRFGQLRWQVPTRVYARPLTLAPGLAMDARTLKTELDSASYRDDGKGEKPGTYGREGARWRIASRGYQDPKRCPSCRQARRAERGGGSSYGRTMYDAVCANCGTETQVPFLPRQDRPVYCSDCFAKMKPARSRWG